MKKMLQRIAQSCLEFDISELCIARKNYANLQAIVKIFQLFISKLSKINASTNQILIPGAAIMERQHQWNVYSVYSLITRMLSARPASGRLDYT